MCPLKYQKNFKLFESLTQTFGKINPVAQICCTTLFILSQVQVIMFLSNHVQCPFPCQSSLFQLPLSCKAISFIYLRMLLQPLQICENILNLISEHVTLGNVFLTLKIQFIKTTFLIYLLKLFAYLHPNLKNIKDIKF